MSPKSKATSESRLLRLPSEIRLEILRHLSLASRVSRAPTQRNLFSTILSLLLPSRQIYRESHEVFYNENAFVQTVTNYDHLHQDLEILGVCLVAWERKAQEFCPCTLKVLVVFQEYHPIGIHTIFVFAEDLLKLCTNARIMTPHRECVMTVHLELTKPMPRLTIAHSVVRVM